jgi:hypothetical protein
MKTAQEPRTDQLDLTTPISYSSFFYAEREFLHSKLDALPAEVPSPRLFPRETKSEKLIADSIIHTVNLPLRHWVKKLSRLIHFQEPLFFRPTIVDSNDKTVPLQREMEHPYFWIKMLRNSESSPNAKRDERSAFFYSKAVETALNHLNGSENQQVRESMLRIILDLVINHKTDGTGKALYVEQNDQAIAAIQHPLSQALSLHIEKTLASQLPFTEKLQRIDSTAIILWYSLNYTDKDGPLFEMYNRTLSLLSNYVLATIQELMTGNNSPKKKVDKFTNIYEPIILGIVDDALGYSQMQTETFYGQLVDLLIDFQRNELLSRSQHLNIIRQILRFSEYCNEAKWQSIHSEIRHTVNQLATVTFIGLPPEHIPSTTRFDLNKSAQFIQSDAVPFASYRYLLHNKGEFPDEHFFTSSYRFNLTNRLFTLRVRQSTDSGCRIDFALPFQKNVLPDDVLEPAAYLEAIYLLQAITSITESSFREVELNEASQFFPLF